MPNIKVGTLFKKRTLNGTLVGKKKPMRERERQRGRKRLRAREREEERRAIETDVKMVSKMVAEEWVVVMGFSLTYHNNDTIWFTPLTRPQKTAHGLRRTWFRV